VLVRGLAALVKSVVLVGGVPLAVGRLWLLLPGPRTPLTAAAWHGARAGGHGVLVAVATIWLVASAQLARDLGRALTGRLGSTTGSWSTRWASRVAGLLLVVSAGSVASAGLAAASSSAAVPAPTAPAVTAPASAARSTSLSAATTLPTGSTAAAAAAAAAEGTGAAAGSGGGSTTADLRLYRVEPGDCLASIAARELGSAGDWLALARLNMGRRQPDGRRMTDPSLIYPGWVLVLPASQPTAEAPTDSADGPARAPTPVAAPTQAGVDVGEIAPPGDTVGRPVHAPRELEQSRVLPRSLPDRPDRSSHVATRPAAPTLPRRHLDELAILGVGLLGATGLARRLRSQRRARECLRRPGERVMTPAHDTGRAAALLDPLADVELLDWVDVANRLLWRECRRRAEHSPGAPLPQIRRVRVGPDGVDLELLAPITEAVAGFTAREHGRVWSLDTGDGLAALSARAHSCGRYAPLLVPVGDAADASYLVALGPGRRLSIDGTLPYEPCHVPTAVDTAADRSASEHATQAGTLAGILVALSGVPWSSELQVEIVGATLPDNTTRRLGLNTSSATELAELARDPATTQLDRLASNWSPELLVVVGSDPVGGDRARVDDALLDEVGRRAGIVSLGGPAADRIVVGDGCLLLEPGGIELHPLSPTTAQLGLLEQLLEESESDPLPVVAASGGPRPRPGPPGPVEIRLLRRTPEVLGWVAEPSSKDRSRVIELLAFLALHGHAASGDRIRSSVFSRGEHSATLGRVHNVCSTARRALGSAPDGHSYLPAATRGRYRLDPAVTTDWERFEAMRLLALDAEPAEAVTLLSEALEMLESPPLADVACGWDWMLAEGILAAIVAAIVDAAHHLATLGLATGDAARARWAIAKGRIVEPWSETLARDTMTLADAEGDRDAIRRAWQDLEGALDRLDGNEPSPETRALFESLVGHVT